MAFVGTTVKRETYFNNWIWLSETFSMLYISSCFTYHSSQDSATLRFFFSVPWKRYAVWEFCTWFAVFHWLFIIRWTNSYIDVSHHFRDHPNFSFKSCVCTLLFIWYLLPWKWVSQLSTLVMLYGDSIPMPLLVPVVSNTVQNVLKQRRYA